MAEEKCMSKISFGDDFGDNSCTFHCKLLKGHEGLHQELGSFYDQQPYEVKWEDIKQKSKEECIKKANDLIKYVLESKPLELTFEHKPFPDYEVRKKIILSKLKNLIKSTEEDPFDSNIFLEELHELESEGYSL